jgi:hypothetical protein
MPNQFLAFESRSETVSRFLSPLGREGGCSERKAREFLFERGAFLGVRGSWARLSGRGLGLIEALFEPWQVKLLLVLARPVY